MRKTAYSSRFKSPLRAPTIRSVPEIVLAKLVCASVLTRSTTESRAALTAIDASVRMAVVRRFIRLLKTSERVLPMLCSI